MDTWKYFDITHTEHVICNPSSLEKVGQVVRLLRLQPGARVLELACGKGEFLVQVLESYAVSATGVDISPYCIRDAQAKVAERVPDADVTLLEMDGAAFQPQEGELYDLTVCLGASWIFGGHRGTLAALQRLTRPGGQIVVGEPFWLQEPDPAYLELSGMSRDEFGTHYENAAVGQALDLSLLYSAVSSREDWDVYEGLQWYASEQYARRHADDPDVPELLEKQRRAQQAYLQYGWYTLGWAIYLFRNQS